MFELQNILVIVDFRQSQHYSLSRAIELANLFDSKITVVSSVYESFMDFIPSSSAIDRELIKKEVIDEYQQRLEGLVAELDTESVEVNYKVLWNKSIHRGLIDFINTNNVDLVVKTARSHNALRKLLFTPTDWHLLRDTKTSILFVKKANWPSKTSVLGAINIEDDETHLELNKKIILTTVELASKCHSVANILNVFPWPAIQFEKFNYLFEKKDLFLEIKEKHTNAVKAFVKSISNISGKVIVAEGLEPEETIPEVIKSNHCDLLVIGTVGRKGIEGAVIGNTAEKILDEIECEVLALK